MSHGDRLDIAGIIIALLGIAVFYLAPGGVAQIRPGSRGLQGWNERNRGGHTPI